MREDAIADLYIFDIFHAIGGNYFLTREQTSDNWLDACLLGALIEIERAIHAAVVGERKRVHAASLRRRDQAVQPRLTIEEAVLGVDVQVSEIRHNAPPCGMMNANEYRLQREAWHATEACRSVRRRRDALPKAA
jgi:hypothetical protein